MDRIADWENSIEAWKKLQQELMPTLEYAPPKKTWHDYLADIPYHLAYWFSYPFVWLVFWLWQGIMQAREEIWMGR